MPKEPVGKDGSESLNRPTCPAVIVKFKDSVEMPYIEGVEKHLPELERSLWNKLFESAPGIKLRPLLTACTPEQIRGLVERAREMDTTYRPPNFLSYFKLECATESQIQIVLTELRSWKSVEAAQRGSLVGDPTVNDPENLPYSPDQKYLDAAPVGIDARYAWTLPGGDGKAASGPSVQMADIELGWTLDHEDLPTKGTAPLSGQIVGVSRYHGTAVLGIICAVDNGRGCIGAVPNVAPPNVISYSATASGDPPDDTNIPNAVFVALGKLSFGDVLLLEMQARIMMPSGVLGGVPVEGIGPGGLIFQSIRLASALGIVVVQAAGNGAPDPVTGISYGINLDVYPNWSSTAEDSGAIMVAGASEAVTNGKHHKTRGSNFGTRIDCYAWGENVTTTYSDWNPGSNSYTTDSYTSGFSGTSSAAAIVAGAALSVQAMAQAALGFRFSPAQLRAILRDRTAGVPGRLANTASDDLIGVMPNLAYISQAVLRIAPDIYIRDFLGDTGDPHLGAISCSPDVIVRNAIEPDPQAAFGAGSGNENNDALGSDVIAGQDNFIYVRVLNRGGSAAANVEATVYWSPVATLVTPNLWTLVGSTNLPNVPVNSLTVSDAIKWTSANIPAAGHYCFVALVGNNADPAPDRAEFRNWTNYENFIRNNNNVTWRNFNVVVPMMKKRRLVGRSRYAEFPFLATGTPEKARKMGLAIVARLPEGARVLLEGPASFLDGFSGKVLPENDLSAKIKMMPINPLGRHDLGEAIFPAWSRTPLRLLVHVPDEARGNTYQIHVSQFFEGLEVGRVTWRLTGDGEKNARKE